MKPINQMAFVGLVCAALGVSAPVLANDVKVTSDSARAGSEDVWDVWEIESESPHPPGHSVDLWWEFYSQGAKAIKVYFEKVDTESCCDAVGVYNGMSVEKSVYKGALNGFWSDAVEGEMLRVRYTSDSSVDSYGFKITQMAVRY